MSTNFHVSEPLVVVPLSLVFCLEEVGDVALIAVGTLAGDSIICSVVVALFSAEGEVVFTVSLGDVTAVTRGQFGVVDCEVVPVSS